jgi:dGTPase
MDDGFESRILNVDELRRLPLFDRYYVQVDAQHPTAPRKLKFNETVKRIFDHLVTDLIENTRKRIRESGVKTVENVRACPERLAAFSPEVEAERKQAKAFLYENLYFSEALTAEKIDAELIVGGLFGHFMAHPESLPPAYQDKAAIDSLARVVCDYIAGMTDNFIQQNYERLMTDEAPHEEP